MNGAFRHFAYSYLAKLLLKPNRAARYPTSGTIDLSGAQTDVSLGISGLTLTIWSKGTGTWTIKIQFADDSTLELASTGLDEGDVWEGEFSDVLFTNTAQASVTGPSFLYDWRATG